MTKGSHLYSSLWFPLQGDKIAEHAAMEERANRVAGPEPEYEAAEYVRLFEVALDEWQPDGPKELMERP